MRVPTGSPTRQSTTYYFRYGTTAAYGLQSSPQNSGSGTVPVGVHADIYGLTANTTYHYQLVAQNAGGTSYGADQTLTTTSSQAVVLVRDRIALLYRHRHRVKGVTFDGDTSNPCGGRWAQMTRPCRTVWSGDAAGECSLATISASTRGAREVRTGYQRDAVSYARSCRFAPRCLTVASRCSRPTAAPSTPVSGSPRASSPSSCTATRRYGCRWSSYPV
jgi:hypothetical protein